MLTGRREDFDSIGKPGGISKFLRRTESDYDHFGAGHAGTSISAALGMARAKHHQGDPGYTIALIGDGSMTAGGADFHLTGLSAAGFADFALSASKSGNTAVQLLPKLPSARRCQMGLST